MKIYREQVLDVFYQVLSCSGWLKKEGQPDLWLAKIFFTSLLPLSGIWWKFTGSKYSTFCTKFLFSKLIEYREMAALAFDWLKHFPLLMLQLLNKVWWKFTGSKYSMSSSKFVFFWPIEKQRWLHWPLIGWAIFYFTSASAKQNLTIMIESKYSTSSSKFLVTKELSLTDRVILQ